MSYDAAGNVTADPRFHNQAYSYDGNDPVNQTDSTGLMADASTSYGEVAGMFWGEDLNGNGSHFGGPGIISDRENEVDERMAKAFQNAADKRRANKAIREGNYALASAIVASNSNLTFADESKSEVTVEAALDQWGVSATVYFWAPHGDSVGHLSVQFSNGIYISLWPKGSPGKPAAVTDVEFDAVLNTYNKDVEAEGHAPDESFAIEGLNGSAIGRYYENLKANPGKWMRSRNCADAVAEALTAGGLVITNTQSGSSIPREVLNIIKQADTTQRNTEGVPTWRTNHHHWWENRQAY